MNSDTINHVRLSESGLLIEIETRAGGRLTGAVQIDRRAWASTVEEVGRLLAEQRLMAQLDNLVADAIDGGDA